VDKVPVKNDPHQDARRLSAARATLGAAYLLSPALGRLARRGADGSAAAPKVLKILGVRHLGQALITTAWPHPAVIKAGSGADAAHAASMVILGLLSRPWRKAAFTDALIAGSLAAAGLACARQAGRDEHTVLVNAATHPAAAS
jgi:hypothetical protein